MASETKVASSAYKVIGTRPIRHDGVDKVTGKAMYGADIRLPGMLYGKVLRGPHPHARIKSIDTAAAKALAGVSAVITSADFPGAHDTLVDLGEGAINFRYASNNVMAGDKVLYKGQPVAAVAALDKNTALEAAALIKSPVIRPAAPRAVVLSSAATAATGLSVYWILSPSTIVSGALRKLFVLSPSSLMVSFAAG